MKALVYLGPGKKALEQRPKPEIALPTDAIVKLKRTRIFELCQKIIAPGGTLANIGVHGTKVDLHLENLWDRNITITTRLVVSSSTRSSTSTKLSPMQRTARRSR